MEANNHLGVQEPEHSFHTDIAVSAYAVEDWADSSPFKKGDQRMYSNYRGITLLSLPGEVYLRMLERRF